MNGIVLTFHLAGINNQNFLMRDDQTGSYWQQISGRAISGPLAGRTLALIRSDELTFGLWKQEQPHGTVMKDVPAFTAEYAPRDWDVRMKRVPVVISHAEPGLAPRDLMFGVHAGGAARAFPVEVVKREKLILDGVGSEPVLILLGPDNQSLRAFSRTLPNGRGVSDFYRLSSGLAIMVDSVTGSQWNFQGCAIEGSLLNSCLASLDALQDYWFDWREYNPSTTIFGKTRTLIR